jgi:hypothetical protein
MGSLNIPMTQKKTNPAPKGPAWAKKNGDFLAIALVSAFVTFFIYVAIVTTNSRPSGKPFNFGFGPKWIANLSCTSSRFVL